MRKFIKTFQGGLIDIGQIVEVLPHQQNCSFWDGNDCSKVENKLCTIARLENGEQRAFDMSVEELQKLLQDFYSPPMGIILDDTANDKPLF